MLCKNCRRDIIRQQKDGDYCDLCSTNKIKGKTDYEIETIEGLK